MVASITAAGFSSLLHISSVLATSSEVLSPGALTDMSIPKDDSCTTGFLFSHLTIFVSMIPAVFPQIPFIVFLLKIKLCVNNKLAKLIEDMLFEKRTTTLMIGGIQIRT